MFDERNTRNLPGWKSAPIPICLGGDIRALAFCCHPHYDLTHSPICRRKAAIEKIGLTEDEYIQIKDAFSKRFDWGDPRVCFKSLAYCCMRRDGCPNTRDYVLYELYGDNSTPWEKIQEAYFSRKRLLCIEILKAAKKKTIVTPYLEFEGKKWTSTLD